MKYALIFTGILAALAIAAPKLVVLAYFLLIVPGLILTVAPTVFVYLVATAVIKKFLPISSPTKSFVAALGISLVIGWAVMQPFRLNPIATYKANKLPDVVPAHAIELDGAVRIERPDHRREPECDYLTLALLDSPLVRSVTTETAGCGKPSSPSHSAAYTLNSAQANSAVSIFPSQPGQIIRKYPPLRRANGGKNLLWAPKAVEANWAVRLANSERLRNAKPTKAESADWVIRIENKSGYQNFVRKRITIFDSRGTVRFRKSYLSQAVPARMFYIGFQVSMSDGVAMMRPSILDGKS